MKLITSFLRLIRSLNLLFIVLTQSLFQYFIIVPLFSDREVSPELPIGYFVLLSLSSVLIAAAGYIINDYFDLDIDRINKPQKLVVEKVIRRRWAIMWHWILSFAGVIIGLYVGWKAGALWLGFANIACVAALWFYSTTFKKKAISGNIIISLLTAWVVLVVGFVTHYRMIMHTEIYGSLGASKLMRLTFLYAGFAFIISLVREVVKDIEDMRGDAKYGARTMPVIWGVQTSKMFACTWLAALISVLLVVQAYALQFRWWLPSIYCLAFILAPLVYILRKLIRAKTTEDFGKLSSWIKLAMFCGIVSMAFFYPLLMK